MHEKSFDRYRGGTRESSICKNAEAEARAEAGLKRIAARFTGVSVLSRIVVTLPFIKETNVTNMPTFAPLTSTLTATVVAAALLAGCGGGGYGGSAAYPGPVNNPSPNPSPQTVPLSTMTLKGAPGLVNNANFTVYVFDLDLQSPGQSSCNGQCAQNWPPLIAPSGNLPSPYSAIARQDGRSQLAYNGRPLYTFAGDGAPGQTNGDNLDAFGGIWHIARP